MPIDPAVVEHQLGHPGPDDRTVLVSVEGSFGSTLFHGGTIPLDGRRYILNGKTILPNGASIISRLAIDTNQPSLLTVVGGWYVGGVWYHPFEPEALRVLGLADVQPHAFSWVPNVPIDSPDQPPYLAGQPVRRKPRDDAPRTPRNDAPRTPRNDGKRWWRFW